MRKTLMLVLLLVPLSGCTDAGEDLDAWNFTPDETTQAVDTADDDDGGTDASETSAEGSGAAAGATEDAAGTGTDADPADPTARSVRFLSIGDQGTGGEDQYRVAEAMKKVCDARGCDFVLTNGDNIYEVGPQSHYDDQFETKFEQPYADFDVPFYLSLGNHDNGMTGTVTVVGEFEVLYSERTDRTSDKWHMPDRWYTFEAGDGLVQFFALDTNTLTMESDPANPSFRPGSEQQAWLADEMAASTALWKIPYAHHPYVSNGEHGDGTAALQAAMEATFCDDADVFFSGHEHDMQWLRPVESCGKTEFIVTGAAGKTRSAGEGEQGVDLHEFYFNQGDTFGFTWVEIVEDAMTVVFYDDATNVLFERTVTKDGLATPEYGTELRVEGF